ncbi:protein-L-isoaspartate O-methyltransferase family protein [Natronobacterium gregoryi]|uniref:protein-L-isoaspartate(D-aspartate) O-methyltransferase n=2 Tax=Natronobacterium gregoryi TaxID=44930 RepID=L0AI58_NATGS|nr:protein-L-isoaspartate O-methyltransferase [Natronobacterium gregoryi]AFZ72857.1 protein-L-isoaspartate carboxylmethyltransferase [Natronobacterium gregoryi SP2]ELY69653.1 protein-L-isoaspartate(D-aspartate) O-methyltransferase [Natronobacterium gregoryi SP2]PLK21914.1 protein-L-isoaspartate O-methyltransferase [Natronobacterium gregoryi SP2]SFI65862.1 protein-L-isoaspartate(D-aspartate) O-methyltransferase [Natronobacterium gregoryi]
MEPAVLRDDMVDGLTSPPKEVLSNEAVALAMRDVSRHEFLEEERVAYADREHETLGTRVLAPSTVARLFDTLSIEDGDSVLIVGAGVGYTAAVAAELTDETNVHAIDIARPLVGLARENLARAGYNGVLVDRRDGASGLPEYAPFDRILLEAAAVEPPRALLDQLAEDGRLVFPCGTQRQRLVSVSPGDKRREFGIVSFDPLLVDGEQAGAVERNRTEREDRERARKRLESRAGWEREWIEWDRRVESGPN